MVSLQPIAVTALGLGFRNSPDMAKVAPNFLGATFAMERSWCSGSASSSSYIRDGLSNRCPTRCCLAGGPAVPLPGPPVPVVALAVGVAAAGAFAVC
jgi:hypothetical protein